MDNFLTGLYHEEMEKGASAQMGEFMDALPASDLEQYLGIDKLAVGGSSNPPLPDSAQGAELDAKQKEVNENCCKEHLSSIPKRGDGADPSVSFQSEGKQPTESPDEAKQVSKQAMACADYVGRMFAKTAASGKEIQHTYETGATPLSPGYAAAKGGILGGGMGALTGGLGGAQAGGLKGALLGAGAGALLGGGVGAGSGATLAALKRHQLKSDKKQIAKINKTAASGKEVQHTYRSGVTPLSPAYGLAKGAITGGALGAGGGFVGGGHYGGLKGALLGAGAGALLGGGVGAGTGATMSALKRMQLKSDKKQIAKLNKQGEAGCGMEKDDAFTSPEAVRKARVMSATMKMNKGAPAEERKAALSRAGKMKLSMGDEGGDMETLAFARAEIAARALRSTSGAPQHIKMAAAALAGRQIAKLAAKPDWYDRTIQSQQGMKESKGLQGTLGGVGGGLIGGSLGALHGQSRRGVIGKGIGGAAAGAALGAGAGLLSAHLAKKKRRAMGKM